MLANGHEGKLVDCSLFDIFLWDFDFRVRCNNSQLVALLFDETRVGFTVDSDNRFRLEARFDNFRWLEHRLDKVLQLLCFADTFERRCALGILRDSGMAFYASGSLENFPSEGHVSRLDSAGGCGFTKRVISCAGR